jgi:hypothetical protein
VNRHELEEMVLQDFLIPLYIHSYVLGKEVKTSTADNSRETPPHHDTVRMFTIFAVNQLSKQLLPSGLLTEV